MLGQADKDRLSPSVQQRVGDLRRDYALCLTTGAIIHMWVFLDTGVKEL
jgi:hypothetical protein